MLSTNEVSCWASFVRASSSVSIKRLERWANHSGERCFRKVAVQTITEERCNGCAKHRDDLQALMQGLIGCELIRTYFAFPEPSSVQPNVPVAKVLDHEVLNGTCSNGGFVIGIIRIRNDDQ